jgi:hypothetical protein
MTRIAPAKIHAQADHTSGILQIHFEHIGEAFGLILTSELKIQDNIVQQPDKARFVRVDAACIPLLRATITRLLSRIGLT